MFKILLSPIAEVNSQDELSPQVNNFQGPSLKRKRRSHSFSVSSGILERLGLRQMRKRVKLEDPDERSLKRSPKTKAKSEEKRLAPSILRKKFGIRVSRIWTNAGYVMVIREPRMPSVEIINSSSGSWFEKR
uniref:GG17523 n=1 Tax=Drosophila erecta TaxID=7220 RepID=B3P1N9_DROER